MNSFTPTTKELFSLRMPRDACLVVFFMVVILQLLTTHVNHQLQLFTLL